MKAHLYILTGPSGCGKTTLLNGISAIEETTLDPSVMAIRAPKYSERAVRTTVGEIDDITHVDQIDLADFDIAYVINNVRYGIRIEPIRNLLHKGLNAFIVLSDFRVIKQLKSKFGESVKALYVSSAIDANRLRRIQFERLGFKPTSEQKSILAYHFAKTSAAARLGWWDRVSQCMTDLESDWHAYATDARSTEIRAQKIRAFHIRYIEHLQLFDNVILNYSENNPQEMVDQVKNLISQLDYFAPYKQKQYPPIFVVAAASGAGKGTLMEMLHFIGRDKVRITSKLAKRAPKDGDKRDGMIALQRSEQNAPQWPAWWTDDMRESGKAAEFPSEYDLRWVFHKRHGSNAGGTEYAVSSTEIQRNLDNGMPQIFISNMSEFETFRSRWPHNTVFLYLHRLVSAHENREFQMEKWRDDPGEAETRIAEKQHVHDMYVKNIAEFDHVLLNTAYQEDLYDQMFRLLEFYSNRA